MNESPANAQPVDAEPRAAGRLWRLALWLGFVASFLAFFWQMDVAQDYKNTAAVVALVLATAGASLWMYRSTGGTRRARMIRAAAAWAPLLTVSPIGPVEIEINGNVGYEGWRWRWAPKPDELLASVDEPSARIQLQPGPNDYPAFLGGRPTAEVTGVALDAAWTTRPPKEVWRQPIGAGWSGFAIVGDYAFTQEQRGEHELVACYELRTGKVAWAHEDDVRWDPGGSGALGGVGPRATPTIHDGRVYAYGSTGILNCIDGATGKLAWSHATLAEEGAASVMWGKACSPVVVDDWIVVSVGGSDGRSLVAYDLKSGKRAWSGGNRQSSYATPVVAELDGVRQIVVVNEDFVTAHDPTNGAVLWEHEWPGNSNSNASASQPVPIGGNRLLLTKGYSVPAEVIEVRRSPEGRWSAETLWTKPVLRTKLSNVLVRDGFGYAISDVDLECVNLETGRRVWKSRRRPAFGNGQIMMVGEHILALSEEGEVILVAVDPTKYREAASFPAIKGVTWNNPALTGRYLLVRNAREAACYELPLKDGGG